jgi:sensor histidine kinase YesM
MGTYYFLIYQIFVVIALIADIIAWTCEGNPSLMHINTISNTVMACGFRIAIAGFIGYLTSSLYANSRAAYFVFMLLNCLCVLSILFCIGNAFFGYAYYVTEAGHYEHSGSFAMGVCYLLYPIISTIAVVLVSLLAKRSSRNNSLAFLLYTIFPLAGVIIDYTFHGIAMKGAGFAISILVIYTSIYRVRRKELENKRTALMLSQINPHFIYNTFSAIAATCDSSPKQAKQLTIDFAQYLRRNINSLSCEDLISFDQELEHVECYLKIEKARFRESLNVIYSIQCRNFYLPPLTLQPLVENAVKHGITKRVTGGTVKISTYEEETYYVVEIIDDGVGFDVEKAEMHVGLENVRSRLAAMCKADMQIKSTVGVGTRIRLEIPKKKGKRK